MDTIIFFIFIIFYLTLIRVGRQTEIYAPELVTLVVAFQALYMGRIVLRLSMTSYLCIEPWRSIAANLCLTFIAARRVFSALDIYRVLTTSIRHKPEIKYHKADHRAGNLNLSILATDVTQQGVRGFCVVPVCARNSSQGSASTLSAGMDCINMDIFSMGCRCYNYGGNNS